MKFALAIHKDPGTCYGVTVPDVPGCFSAGDTPEEAIASAREAIRGHIETLHELDELFALDMRPLEEHQANPDFAGAAWAIVDVEGLRSMRPSRA